MAKRGISVGRIISNTNEPGTISVDQFAAIDVLLGLYAPADLPKPPKRKPPAPRQTKGESPCPVRTGTMSAAVLRELEQARVALCAADIARSIGTLEGKSGNALARRISIVLSSLFHRGLIRKEGTGRYLMADDDRTEGSGE